MEKKPGVRDATKLEWLGVLSAVLGAFMAVLDISITNAAMQDIQGGLSASLDEGSWIATAYLVAEIIMIPLTGFLSDALSVRRFLLWTGSAFLVMSMACGLAWNLPSMIVFRALQGFTGGALIPVAITIIVTTLPVHQRSIGMALFAGVATFAPSIGPTIGGWISVNYGWEYIFYLNVFPGALMLFGIASTLPKGELRWQKFREGDWLGIIFMALALGSIEVVLEEGTRKDWFGSHEITTLFWIFVVSFVSFLWWELTREHPFINLRILKRRNFLISNIVALALGLGLYGSIYVLPLYLGSIQGYNALQIGEVLMWVGLPQLVIIPFMPKLSKMIDVRILIGLGLALFALSCYQNVPMTYLTAGDQIRFALVIRALGQPLIITPLSSITYSDIDPKDVGSASGLYNMMRNLGGSLGIGVISTMLNMRYQFHYRTVTAVVSPWDPKTQSWLNTMQQVLQSKGASAPVALQQATFMVHQLVNREANLLAFSDVFLFMTIAIGGTALIVAGFRKVDSHAAPVEGAH